MKKKDVTNWLVSFQQALNIYATNDFLKFTATIWGGDRDDESKNQMVNVDSNEYFPFLDMELFWHNDKLSTRVHLKPNQQLKYLNADSTHTPSCFKSISRGVLKRLSKLTTITHENQKKSMKDLYPQHFNALEIANLPIRKILSFEKIDINKADELIKMNKRNKPKEVDNRHIYFCIGYSTFWPKPVHVTIKKLIKQYKLTWLVSRISVKF